MYSRWEEQGPDQSGPSAPPQRTDPYYPPLEKPTQPHPSPNHFSGPPPPGPGVYYSQPNNFLGPPPTGPNAYHPQPNNFSGPPPPGLNTYHPKPNNSAGPPPPGPGPQVVSGIPVVGNPQHVVHTPPVTHRQGYWSTGLCDCFSDIQSCCLVCWCPCVAFGQLAEIVDKGSSSCCCSGSLYLGLCSLGAVGWVFGVPLSCQWIYSCTYRGKIKQDLGMSPDCVEECCIHFWCEPCALCQEYREIQQQGYDLSLGWYGNLEKLGQGRGNGMPATVAPVSPAMAR